MQNLTKEIWCIFDLKLFATFTGHNYVSNEMATMHIKCN